MPRYYLDTSAQIARHGGSSESVRRRVKELLRGGGHATSSQVQREWNRFVLAACTTLRNALAKAGDWDGVVAEMRKGFGGTASRNWLVTHWITGSAETDLALTEKRAEDFQRIRARMMFMDGIEEIRDGTQCEVARRQPEHSGRGGRLWRYQPTCKKDEQLCRQPDFLDAEITRARAAARALEHSSRPADKKMGKKSAAALERLAAGDVTATKGRECHGKNGIGGDIAIALECKAEETLVATDESFDLICPAIGVTHQRL